MISLVYKSTLICGCGFGGVDTLGAVDSGGGVALLRVRSALTSVETENEDQKYGVDIVAAALTAPIRQMATNCGLSPDLIVNMVESEEHNVGYDFRNDKVVNMFEAGVLDPVKVTRTALQNAASAAGTLITTSHAIIET